MTWMLPIIETVILNNFSYASGVIINTFECLTAGKFSTMEMILLFY